MFSVSTNKEKNRIYIKLGAADTGEGEKLIQQIRTEITKLSPGFTCVSDISNFSLNDPAESKWAEEILKTLADAGLSRAIRVVGYDIKYYESKGVHGYSIGLAKSVQDADKILDSL
ncbi:MAG: hypothetical protein GY729_02795 [Desulfobacteraceae bacterium]|nr:hypothetical protein [Desulfobacteraceae bacterium]